MSKPQIYDVEIIRVHKYGPSKAKQLYSKYKPIPICFSNEFEKAFRQLSRVKHLVGTRWKAVKRIENGRTMFVAIEKAAV